MHQLHIKRLKLYTNKHFVGSGGDLRRAITAQFKDIEVLHNHKDSGFNYRAPRVRYAVIDGLPELIAFDEGLEIIEQLYRQSRVLKVGARTYEVTGTELIDQITDFGIDSQLRGYRSITPWLGINQQNLASYQALRTDRDRNNFLGSVFIGNYLSLAKTLGVFLDDKMQVFINHATAGKVKHADVFMHTFTLELVCNAIVPEGIGLGKLTSKGFGLMKEV